MDTLADIPIVNQTSDENIDATSNIPKEKLLIELDSIAGTRNFFPEDMRIQNWLFDIWKSVSQQFGFSQYDAPVLEKQSLYTRKGDDDIVQEMFAFKLGGHKLTLRSETTPSVSRMIMSRYSHRTESPPLRKVTQDPQSWRHEEIKRGRKREHYQWNCDIFGAEKIASEIEVFLMVISFFQRIGLTYNDVVLKVSNRMILQTVMNRMGVPQDLFARACIIIDKRAKITTGDLYSRLQGEIHLTEAECKTINDLCAIRHIKLLAEFLGPEDETYLYMQKLFIMAEQVGIKEWLCFDVSVVLGLSYYTGVVFEGFCISSPNLQKSICGGGRYDDLLQTYRYKEYVPAVGFGFGDVVILELLKDMGKLPILSNLTRFLVAPFDAHLYVAAVQVSQAMRAAGINVDMLPRTDKTKICKVFEYADRKQIDNVILIAPDEWASGKVVWKKLRETDPTLKQLVLPLKDLLQQLC
jgi:histidyl-tRNA synthetase